MQRSLIELLLTQDRYQSLIQEAAEERLARSAFKNQKVKLTVRKAEFLKTIQAMKSRQLVEPAHGE